VNLLTTKGYEVEVLGVALRSSDPRNTMLEVIGRHGYSTMHARLIADSLFARQWFKDHGLDYDQIVNGKEGK